MTTQNATIKKHSYGQLWFGTPTFPGFLYKKQMGGGVRRVTMFRPGPSVGCSIPTTLYNTYRPNMNGVGAVTRANRRALNRRAAAACTYTF